MIEVRCGRHGYRPGRKHQLRWPQPPSTPKAMLYACRRGPDLWMCDECSAEAADWAEPCGEPSGSGEGAL